MPEKKRINAPRGFTLVEILVALVITSILTIAIYSFFIGQHHAYTVQDQVIEMEQNARAALDMIRKELRMAGYHAMGDDLINNLSDFVPSSFIPTYPVTVNLDANPKISEGSGTDPDMITFLSVVPTNNNPTTISSAVAAGENQISLALNNSDTDTQYNVGDMIHIGTTSEYATVTAISDNTLTIDTNPGNPGSSQGLARGYAAGTPIGEIYVVSYAVFNDDNDPVFDRHDPGHPVLKRKINAGGFQPVAENITDMQLRHLGSGEIELTLSSRTDRADQKFQNNGGYRSYTANAKVKVRNADTVSVGTDCDLPSAPANVVLNGLNDTYPCQIHIAWDEVTGTTGCEVTNYIVYYGTTSGAYTYNVDVGDVTSYVLDVTPLKACQYFVAVSAVNSAGKGPKSVEKSITDILAPAMPAGFNAKNINGVERKVTLSWNMNTECDLEGYNIFGRSDSLSGTAPKINAIVIPKSFTNYSDTNFTPIDCDTYHYSMEAVDFCPNSSGITTEVSVSPTAPATPTGPRFFRSDTGDTISWVLSKDDFVVNDLNYIVGYRIVGYRMSEPNGTHLATLDPGISTWTSESQYDYYDVSAIDACGNESIPLTIASICLQSPTISLNSPEGGATISGTVSISVSTDAPSGRTIASVQLQINEDPWLDISGPSPWESEWETTALPNGSYTITVRSTDSEGCYAEESIIVTVSNDPAVIPQVFCTLFTCKDPPDNKGNSYINLVVYVYDHEGNPVSDATSVEANIKFGSGSGFKDIPPSDIAGYYGGQDIAACTLYSTDPEAPIPPTGLAVKTKSTYKDHQIPTIEINVAKEGFLGSACTITPTAE